jgi:hypothetical protein
MKRALVPSFLAALLAVASAAEGKVESAGACTDPAVSEAVRAALEPAGVRVTGTAGVLCEIWLRRSIPQKAGASAADYSALATGTLIGVIRYPAKVGDYRGQVVRPGTYTLRYQTIPQDGNHLGVSPTPDFLLLAPSADDKDPNALVEYADLVKLSKAASGTNHPNPLHLAAPAGGAPAFRSDESGHGILELKVKLKGATGEVDLPLALVLVGKAEG